MAAPDQAPQSLGVAPGDLVRLDPGGRLRVGPASPADRPLHAIKMPTPRSASCPAAPPYSPRDSDILSVPGAGAEPDPAALDRCRLESAAVEG